MPISDTMLPRRVMTLFILIDSSGSMTIDGNMGKINGAIEELIPLLRDISDSNADAEIRIAILDFSTECVWMTNGAESLDTFVWNDMKAGGLTNMGAAFHELESKLSRSAYLESATGNYKPVLLLLSDGSPTDDYKAGLRELAHNNWYKNAVMIAIAVENSAKDMLAEFTGSTETVLMYDKDRTDLQKLLTNMVIVSSSIVSRSAPLADEDNEDDLDDTKASIKTAQDIVKQVKEQQDGKVSGADGNNTDIPDPDAWN